MRQPPRCCPRDISQGKAAGDVPVIISQDMERLAKDVYKYCCNHCGTRSSLLSSRTAEEKAADTECAPYDFRRQHERDGNGGWQVTEILVQNTDMRDVLTTVLLGHPGFTDKKWFVSALIRPLVHEWSRLIDHFNSMKLGRVKDACERFIHFMSPTLNPILESIEQIKKSGWIDYQDIWKILPPKCIMNGSFSGAGGACQLREAIETKTPSHKHWDLKTEFVESDGKNYGWRVQSFRIRSFEGKMRVTSLPTYPLSFNEGYESQMALYEMRGRMYRELEGIHVKSYTGHVIEDYGDTVGAAKMNGRVVVDNNLWWERNGSDEPSLEPLRGPIDQPDDESDEDSECASDEDSESAGQGSTAPKKLRPAVGRERESTEPKETPASKGEAEEEEEEEEEEELPTRAELVCTSPWVHIFDLRHSEWKMGTVDKLSAISWNDHTFSKLVIPQKEKDLTLDFVRNKRSLETSFDDFVENKGRGLILLLAGPPGVGKTYTAEAVAERCHIPLYTLSAGSLGTEPDRVEEGLDHALECTQRWGALLLLDEADVFLGCRTQENLKRNELVSIFLRRLEYFTGIMFLTTNRISEIDPAFESRIDLILPYHELGRSARREVWQNFALQTINGKKDDDTAGGEEAGFPLTEGDLDTLSDFQLNGREIKNLIKSANTLDKGNIKFDKLHTLAELRSKSKKFMGGMANHADPFAAIQQNFRESA